MSEVKTAAQQWQRVKTILADALELESPKERTAFLEGSCDGDTTLMREVEALLAQSTQNLDELAEDTPLAFARHAPAQPSGRRIGAYEIVREIGRGGMGAVYLAKRADGQFEKEVAIKLLKRGTDTDEILRRFHAERRILAQLDHPNIARLLDAGTTDDGLPYFVMEYIDGVPITSYAHGTRLSVAQRLQLFLKVCEAVQFAHQHRVVHRDLKPGNILVKQDGEPKLLDFGIAKFLAAGDEGIDQTLTAERRFTPICASPEQARGETVTPASDVYALGALLYELLTDRPPHRFSTPHPSPVEVAQIIGEQEPIRPSLSIYDNKTRRQLRGDLDRIALMALRKEPVRRYSSVVDFAEDIRRHVQGRAIRARPNTLAYLSRRFVARYKYSVAALGLLAALGTSLGLVLLNYRAELNRRPSFPNSQASLGTADKSIAVLPFEDLSDDKGSAFFADGMQDEILTDLAKVKDLKVISRTSVMQYKNFATRNLREIAQQLGVVHVLEGSVQRVGNRVRVSAQLIDARNDAHLWGEHYEREASDVFAIQNEIAKGIVEQLRAKISPSERKALEEKPTTDLVAYDLYLRGKALMDELATSTDWEGDNRRAIDLLDRAVTHDPKFAAAYAQLCDFHLNLYAWIEHTPQRLAQADDAVQKATRLAPSSAATYLAQANFAACQRKWSQSLEFLQRAQKLQPGNSTFLLGIAWAEDHLGQSREAVRDLEKARELAPRDPNIPNALAWMYTGFRDYRKSDEVADAAIVNFPNGPNYYRAQKVLNALHRGDWNEALRRLALIPEKFDPSGFRSLLRLEIPFGERDSAEFARILASVPRNNFIGIMERDVVFMEALLAEKQGDRAKMESVLNTFRTKLEAELRAEGPDKGPSYHPLQIANLALVHCYLGQMEDALRESQQAIDLAPKAVDVMKWAPDAFVRAEILMRAGETDHALDLLEEVAKVPYGPSYGELLGLQWDRLRDDPRFAKLLEEAAQPIDLTRTEDKKDTEPAAPDKSIAVLPFENLSKDKGNDVFAAGIQDELITDLAQLADLKVISRASVTQYTDATARNVRAIAAELGVAHLLTGTVQRAGDRVRVSAQLLNGRTEAHEWAQQYERDVADVFAIQAEIAQSIAAQLQARISPNEMNAMAQQPTSDLVAYDLYLRGKALWDEITTSTDWEGDNRRAIELLERATTHDPNFAVAYGVLCELHLNLYDWVEHSPARLAQANTVLQHAIRLAPATAETFLAQAEYLGAEKDWKRSLELLQRALQLQPGNAKLFNRIALSKERLGLAQEALRDMEKARELAPRDPNIPNHLMQMYTRVRDYKKSDEVADAALASFPKAPSYFRARQVVNSLCRGDLKQARERLALVPAKFDASGFKSLLRLEIPFFERDYEEFDRVAASIPRSNLIRVIETDVIFFEVLVAEKRNDAAKKESILNALRASLEAELRDRGLGEGPTNNPTQLANLARIHCYLGQTDDALRESEEAVERTPIAVDAVNGPANMSVRAEVLMRTGQTDRAIELLEELAKHPYGVSYGELLSLRWDSLRGDARFTQIVEQLKKRL
jgi:TolB-like protein/Flp pilus assembly protein TadD